MALLAYDPERVRWLRQKMIEASIDLHMLRCTDPAATEAMRVVRRAAAQLDATWLPLVDRLLDSDPLSGRFRKVLGFDSLDQSLVRVMADGYGWSVQHDPGSDDTTVVTAEEARALGAMLNTVGVVALANDPEQLAWLAQQLEVIGRDPALSAEFLANFHDWDVLPYQLAQRRALSFDRDYAGETFAGDIDPVFAGLMAIWATTLSKEVLHAGADASITDLLPPMENPDRYVQALMLSALPLDTIAMATVADGLLREWLDAKQRFGTSIDLEVAFGPNVADLLLQDIAASSVASAAFLALIVDRPALLFETLDDPTLGHQIALRGTDPAHTSSAAAGHSVLSILDYFETNPYETDLNIDGYPGVYGPLLGQLVAPWLLQFTGANDDWAPSSATKARLLAVALDDEDALRALVAASEQMSAGLARTLTVVGNDSETIATAGQIGGLLSLLGQLVVNERIEDVSEHSTVLWDLTWTVLKTATKFVPGGAVAHVAARSGVVLLERAFAPLFLGPTAHDVRQDGELAMDVVLTVTASVMMAAMFQSWQAQRKVDDNATPPPLPEAPAPDETGHCPSSEYLKDFAQWASDLPGGTDGELHRNATDLVEKFIAGQQAEEHCGELAS